MKQFMLIFRNDFKSEFQQSPEQMQQVMTQWIDWLAGITAEGKMADNGNRLGSTGKTVRNELVTDGPFTEIKEIVGGYIIVHGNEVGEAVLIAQKCPILSLGGSVEVRNVVDINGNA
ncbi:YciI family protein [Flavobacterium sp. RHBU_3]|uniref:YciI family protein n=1 Tax=Flavobacterium sp. RHBU_3 TaxID=3391184 RepID=UPI003984A73C